MIIATAGHVDHGKSTLVHRLTGTDPDRWQEERDRGLTIDLGFAWALLASGRTAGFVDVPGHRRFLANMLAGCGAVDGVLLAVSAREGWKPQTEEHVQILHLLGAPTGVVALTHADRVDPQELAVATAQITEHLAGTFLDGAPVVPTAAADPTTIERLRHELDAVVGATPTALDLGRPRLWVDRSFVLDGSGRIVTGTLTGGRLAVGERVTVTVTVTDGTGAPTARIRSIHTYGEATPDAAPGTRVALGLRVDGRAPARGDAVVHGHQWGTGTHLHVALRPVRDLDEPIRARGSYTLHVGTASTPVHLSRPAWAAEQGIARLHLATALGPLTIGDHFILRDAGRDRTVAGGMVIAVDDRVVRYPASQIGTRTAAAISPVGRRHARVAAAVLAEGDGVAPRAAVEVATGLPRPTGTRAAGDLVVSVPALRRARRALRDRLDDAGRIDVPTDPLGRIAARSLVGRKGAVERDGALHDRAADPDAAVAEALADLERAVREDRLGRLFTLDEARRACGTPTRAARRLVDRGDLVEVGALVSTAADFRDFVATVTGALGGGAATAAELKAALGLTRRHAIPLLEALDALGVTRRDGGWRRLA